MVPWALLHVDEQHQRCLYIYLVICYYWFTDVGTRGQGSNTATSRGPDHPLIVIIVVGTCQLFLLSSVCVPIIP